MFVSKKRCWDPLYGLIEFSKEEFSLILTPEVQRLRYLRMCNINSLLVTGASEISRFEHILGVLKLVQVWASNNHLSKDDLYALKAAAILHDILTAPFGHSLQYVFQDNQIEGNFSHEDIEYGSRHTFYQALDANASFLGRPFESENILGYLWNKVSNIIQGKSDLGPLISGSMDLDNIDNVFRMAYHVGLTSHEDKDIPLLLASQIKLHNSLICLPSSAVPLIDRWLDLRSTLYKFLLYDWADFSAKAMLTRIIEDALRVNLLGSDSWRFTDLELLSYLQRITTGEYQDIGTLINRLLTGRLYFPLGLYKSDIMDSYKLLSNMETKRDIENRLYNYSKNKKYDLKIKYIFHPIINNRKISRSIRVLISDNNNVIQLGNDEKSILLGFFCSSPPQNNAHNADILEYACNILHDFGIEDLTLLTDPIMPDTSDNMELDFS